MKKMFAEPRIEIVRLVLNSIVYCSTCNDDNGGSFVKDCEGGNTSPLCPEDFTCNGTDTCGDDSGW